MKYIRRSFTRDKEVQCPWRFHAINLDGVIERRESFTLMGTQLHEIFADFIKKLFASGRPRNHGLFMKVFEDHTSRLDPDTVLEMEAVAGNFVDWFTLDSRAERVLVEHDLAVDRNNDPISIAEALNPDGTAKQDCFTGIMDYMVEIEGGRKALLTDWKCGNQNYDFNHVTKDRQLMGYAYLWMKHHPDCEHVSAAIFAPKYRRHVAGGYDRDVLVPMFDEYLTETWKGFDAVRQAGMWEATPYFRDCCGWCRLLGCPAKAELLRRSA